MGVYRAIQVSGAGQRADGALYRVRTGRARRDDPRTRRIESLLGLDGACAREASSHLPRRPSRVWRPSPTPSSVRPLYRVNVALTVFRAEFRTFWGSAAPP